jgi:hypothetical protein
MSINDFRRNHRGMFGAIVAGFVLLVLVGIGWFAVNQYKLSVENTGRQQQRDIMTLQRQVGLSLSNCLDKTNIASQVANQQYASIKGILQDALSARYTNANGQPTRADSTLGGGAFISSLHEQYPQIDVSTWQKLMVTALGCRDDVYDVQTHLQDNAGIFDKWRQTVDVFNQGIKHEFPTGDLWVVDTASGKKLYANAALDYLTRTIETAEGKKAMSSGTMPDQQLPGLSPSSAAPSPSPTK